MGEPIDYNKPEVQEVVRSQVRGFFKKHLGDGLHFVECLLGKHEPDEELEKAVWLDNKFLEFFKRGSVHTENGRYKDEDRVATVRFCKYCGCLYIEKPHTTKE